MQEYTHLIYDVDENRICRLTLNRPEKLNAVNVRLAEEIKHALEFADADERVNVIVIRGAGRAFCAGHDLTEKIDVDRGSVYAYRHHYIKQFEVFTTAWRISKPVIASVNSIAIGKGFELSLSCDITIVSDDTRMGYNELRYGIPGHCMFLPWLVNMKTAKEILLTGRELTALEAKEAGLVNEVVPLEQLKAATDRKALLMAKMPREMQRVHKTYLNRVYDLQGMRTALDYYLELFALFGGESVTEFADFAKTRAEKGLKQALREANARYEGL